MTLNEDFQGQVSKHLYSKCISVIHINQKMIQAMLYKQWTKILLFNAPLLNLKQDETFLIHNIPKQISAVVA